MVVQMFLVRLFCAPSAAPGGNCPHTHSAPLSYATGDGTVIICDKLLKSQY